MRVSLCSIVADRSCFVCCHSNMGNQFHFDIECATCVISMEWSPALWNRLWIAVSEPGRQCSVAQSQWYVSAWSFLPIRLTESGVYRANADVPTLPFVRSDVRPFACRDDDSSHCMVSRNFLCD